MEVEEDQPQAAADKAVKAVYDEIVTTLTVLKPSAVIHHQFINVAEDNSS